MIFFKREDLKMAVPKQKTSRSRRGHRRSQHKIVQKQLSVCKNCGAFHICHHICGTCGFYAGKRVISIKQKEVATA